MAVSFMFTALVICSARALGSKLSRFDAFIADHARAYQKGSAEYEQRRRLFEERVASYDRHNRNPQRLWNAAVNGLTDWTEEELRGLRGWRGVVANERGSLRGASRPVGRHLDLKQKRALPASKSWAHLKALQKPRNQGACGSCWAYATAVAMEGCYEKAFGAHHRFNPTQLVECAPNPHRCGGDGGCGGSTAEMAMMYVVEHGLSEQVADCSAAAGSESSLGLLERGLGDADWQLFLQPGVHQVPAESPAFGLGLRAWQRLPQNEAEPLRRALVDWGPVAVSLSADYWGGYSDGIFTGCSANSTIDHAVVMIGYGADRGTGFWHIQNSWGKYWGESGRIRIIRRDTDDVDCGTDFHPEQGTGCEGGPATVTVCGECGILYDSVVPHFSKV